MRTTLNGYVVEDDILWLYQYFGYGAFSPQTVRDALDSCPEGEELVLEINSPGGSVFAGFEMYSVLRAADRPTVAEVQSLAASAASTLMLGCDRVLLSPVAQVMIHLPAMVTDGDAGDHRDSIRVLESITESILNAYELRCRGRSSRDELARMMQRTTWMSAQEALDAGLADGVLYADGETPIFPSAIVNAVGGGIRALASVGGMPSAAELRARWEAAGGAGASTPHQSAAPTASPQGEADPARGAGERATTQGRPYEAQTDGGEAPEGGDAWPEWRSVILGRLETGPDSGEDPERGRQSTGPADAAPGGLTSDAARELALLELIGAAD